MWRRIIGVSLLLLAFVGGLVTGERRATREVHAPAQPRGASAPDLASSLAMEPIVATLSALVAPDPSPEVAAAVRPEASLLELMADPGFAIESVTERMTDRELVRTIVSMTGVREEELARVRDLRSYARRLARIAMDDILTEPLADDAAEARADPVMFAQQVDESGLPTEIWERFGPDRERRIYALFPSERYEQDQVLVKWFREGDSKLLLFREYPIEPGAPLSHVWMEPREGWEEGPYVVEFYDPSEPLERIATGRYVVSGQAAF